MHRQADTRSQRSDAQGQPCPGMFFSWCVTGLVSASLLILSGCSRSYWRQNADDNSYAILQDKSSDPRWAPNRLDLEPDERSRFYDPHDPDCAPLPPDDPAAHAYMHWMGRNTGMAKVDQPWTGGVIPKWLYSQRPIKGWKSWHKFGETFTVENPQWLEPYGLTPEQMEEQRKSGVGPGPGVPELTLPQAIELGCINSREFQTQLENVYLTALDLTFERFRFDIRYLGLGGQRPSSSLTYQDDGNTNSLLGTSRIGISRLLPAGGQFVVELANNTLWLFTGGNQSSTASVLSYSIVQPLLLGAGRHVNLESLTQAERDALYAVRDFARFRQVFFVSLVAGGGTGAGGYLGLLQQYQGIRNQRYNILLLNKQLVRLRALAKERTEVIKLPLPTRIRELVRMQPFPDIPGELGQKLYYDAEVNSLVLRGLLTIEDLQELQKVTVGPAFQGFIDIIQNGAAELLVLSQAASNALDLNVTQLESQLLSGQTSLLGNERSFQDALDRYKFLLGLPPDLWMSLNLRQLDQFELISPQLQALEEDLTLYVEKTAVLPENDLVSNELQTLTDELYGLALRAKNDALTLVMNDWKRVQENQARRLEKLPPTFDSQAILNDYERDQRLIGIIRLDIDNEIQELEKLQKLLAQRAAKAPAPEDPLKVDRTSPQSALSVRREQILKLVQNLEVVQINLRVELIELNNFQMTMEEAVQTGLENRVDLMNQRALVMDARRRVEVIANSLRSQVNVVAQGDIRTSPLGSGSTAPFEFRGDQSSFRMGLNFVAPLDQVAQRNNYRAALVAYQRARRSYMQAEDQVKLEIRLSWRQLEAIRSQFEFTRKGVRLAAMQYDQAVEKTLAPTSASTGGGGASSSSTGLNIIQALNTVLNNQNTLISNWASYESNRLNIHRDMGIMQLDERGVWIDDYYQNQANQQLESGQATLTQPSGINVPGVSPVDTPTPPPLLSPDDPAPPAVPATPE